MNTKNTPAPTVVDLANERGFMSRMRAGALSEIEALITGDMPIHHDAEFLRTEIAKIIAECKSTIQTAKETRSY